MQHRREASARMHGHIDRKIAQLDLPANGPQRPLVRQQRRAIRLFARQSGARDVSHVQHGRRLRRLALRGRASASGQPGQQEGIESNPHNFSGFLPG